jgi:hypothetical protein
MTYGEAVAKPLRVTAATTKERNCISTSGMMVGDGVQRYRGEWFIALGFGFISEDLTSVGRNSDAGH